MISEIIGFLGSGKMATALARGVLESGICASDRVRASDSYAESRQAFEKVTGISPVTDNAELVRAVDVVVVCVKPADISTSLEPLRELLAEKLVVSIAAGVPINRLETAAGGPDRRIIRVMPNTPALAGQGAAGFARNAAATKADGKLVEELLGAVGEVFEVKEALLDAVTGLSGSGPAYIYQVIEALSDGGVLMGLPRDVATRLAAQTVIGAGAMVLQTGKHPGELKDMVTSPGGTTIAGLKKLEAAGVRNAFMDAVRAATEKSRSLGQS